MYGWRAKVGLLTPSINTIVEHDFNRMAPPGISIHVSRVATEVEGHLEVLEDMGHHAKDAAVLLSHARPDVVVFGCTSGSFINGHEWTARIEQEIAEVSGCPCVSTARAMVLALAELNIRRVAVLTPYVRPTNERLRNYLAAANIEVTDLKGLEMLDMYSHADVPSDLLYTEARKLRHRDAEAIFIACTQMKTIDIIEVLEQDVRKPVVTAVQASFWAALNALDNVGLPISGYGRLLRGGRAA